jgi:hypothetical protein
MLGNSRGNAAGAELNTPDCTYAHFSAWYHAPGTILHAQCELWGIVVVQGGMVGASHEGSKLLPCMQTAPASKAMGADSGCVKDGTIHACKEQPYEEWCNAVALPQLHS